MAETTKLGQNMRLFKADWNNTPSFRMLPASIDSPYSEVIYDRQEEVLVVISKIPKTHMTMVPRLSPDGEIIAAKKPKANGKKHQEQRVTLDTYQEYYIEDREEIKAFIKDYAVNAKTFKYADLLDKVPQSEILQSDQVGAILDEKGNPIAAK